jgi:probable H4MPT-linked C1 transfer pathway protein
VLVDIGSTTTDLIALRGGRIGAEGRSDAQRLARGELLYQGVVRTPLCAVAPRIGHRGERYNVMNEFFATTADVYRLTGELDPAHDQQPTADGAPKDAPCTRRRLARMIGLDEREASADEWLALAKAWRTAQLAALREELERVVEAGRLGPHAAIIGAGCGDFLAQALAAAAERPYWRFDSLWRIDPTRTGASAAALRGWLQVGAPAAAVAWLSASGWQGGDRTALRRSAC